MRQLSCLSAALLLATGITTTTSSGVAAIRTASGRQPGDASVGRTLAPAVNTTTGNYVGLVNTEYNVNMYKGIPYALPPTGVNRFVATQPLPYPAASAASPVDAFDFAPGCMQMCNDAYGPNGSFQNFTCTATMSEDCLFLNVYTPSNWTSSSELLPVIFFVHGGSFNWGSGGTLIYDGTEWASRENIVLVTINYRLNLFGAMSTADIQGNFQLQDQRHALSWVQDNIAQFGGDKTRVMLSGESAGAMSTGMHLASPASWDLYSSAAVISDPYAVNPLDRATAELIGQDVIHYLGCDAPTTTTTTRNGGGDKKNNATQVLACLQSKTSAQVLNASLTIKAPKPAGLAWVPNVDGVILPHQPIKAAKEGIINNVPLYIGNNANESVLFVYSEFLKPINESELFFLLALDLGTEMAHKVFDFYPKFTPAEKKDARGVFSRMQTDYLFYCPTRRVILDAVASPNFTSNIYYYLYDQIPSYTHWSPSWSYIHCGEEVCHFVAMPFIFDSVRYLPAAAQPTAEEKKLIRFMQKAWASVARTGRMDDGPRGELSAWKPFNNQTLLAYNLSVPLPTPQVSAYRAKFCDFWDKYGYDHQTK